MVETPELTEEQIGDLLAWDENRRQKACDRYTKFRSNHKEEVKAYSRKYMREWNKTMDGKYNRYLQSAKIYKVEFALTKEDFSTFWQKSCSYCGDSIDSIGLDRVDPKIGYLLSNVVACCPICNFMKKNHDLDFFVAHVQKIVEHLHNERSK